MNWLLGATMLPAAYLYHESLWGAVDSIRYLGGYANLSPSGLTPAADLGLALVGCVAAFAFFGFMLQKKGQHNLRHLLYLLPWVALMACWFAFTGPLLTINTFDAAASSPGSLWANLYEIGEVAFFSFSLCFGLVGKGEPLF